MRQLILNRYTTGMCLLLLLVSVSNATAQNLSKYHALFVGKFIDYIEWPEGKGNLTIGVVGDSEVFNELQAGLGQRGKATIKKISGANDTAGCQVIFIPSNENKQFESISNAVSGKHVLLITESEQFARKGASISFYLDSGKLRFFLNEAAAKSHDLKVSSGLLSLATTL